VALVARKWDRSGTRNLDTLRRYTTTRGEVSGGRDNNWAGAKTKTLLEGHETKSVATGFFRMVITEFRAVRQSFDDILILMCRSSENGFPRSDTLVLIPGPCDQYVHQRHPQ